jgi:hypothetical protein
VVGLFERGGRVGLFERRGRVGLSERRGRVGLFERRGRVGLSERRGWVGLFERRGKVGLFERRGGLPLEAVLDLEVVDVESESLLDPDELDKEIDESEDLDPRSFFPFFLCPVNILRVYIYFNFTSLIFTLQKIIACHKSGFNERRRGLLRTDGVIIISI